MELVILAVVIVLTMLTYSIWPADRSLHTNYVTRQPDGPMEQLLFKAWMVAGAAFVVGFSIYTWMQP